MKRKVLRSWFAGIAVLAILISCVLTGLVLPVSAAEVTPTKLTTSIPAWWVMTGRYRDLCTSAVTYTVTYADETTATVSPDSLEWAIADTSLATVTVETGSVKIETNEENKVGVTTLTATVPGSTVTCAVPLHIVDGSKYVYSEIEYEYGDNLVPNGDFASGSEGWVPTVVTKVENGVTYYKHTDADTGEVTWPPFDDSADFVEGTHRIASGFSHHTKALALEPACTYVLSFDYLAAPDTAFQIYGANMFGTLNFAQDSNADGEWHSYSRVFTTPSVKTGSYSLYINQKKVNETTPAQIDNISIRERTSAVEIQNLLINNSELLLQKSETRTLTLWTEPYGGNLNGVVWTSSNASAATVENGVVTAVGAGETVITATTADGKFSASCTVSVVGTGGAELLENTALDDTDSKVWNTSYGAVTRYVAGAGQNGTSVLRVDRNYPVYQAVTGLQPGTTYTIEGSAMLAANSRLVITVTNGDEVLAVLNEEYAEAQWNTVSDGEGNLDASAFSAGYSFTTPDTLKSDTTEIHIAVLKSADDTADTLAEIVTTSTPSGNAVDRGEGEVTDNDDSLEDEGVYYAYIDTMRLHERGTKNVDLTPTDVQWSGDSDNDGQVKPGTAITFKVPVKNVGAADLPAGEAFTVDIAANGKVIRTLTYDGGIAVGETVLVTDTEAWTAEKGDYMISARVNASLSILETNTKTNQTYQLNLRVADDVYTPAYNADVVAQAGMDKLTMSDDFDDLSTVDTLASGAEGYKWYVTRPWSAPTLSPNDYMVNNGVLTLMSEVPTYGIAFNSVDMNTNNGFRYKQGYLEVKLRIVRPNANDAHEEGVPTVWSFTQDKALEELTGTDTHWVELDWLEYWGIHKNYKGGYYTTTFHQSTTVEADPSYSNSNHSLEGLGDAEWHVMGWLWEENSIRTFLDGVEMMNMLVDDEASLVPSARVNKTDADGNKIGSADDIGLFSWMNEEAAVLYLGGSKDNPHEIDYVRIWQASEPETVSDNITLDKTEITMSEDTRERLTVTVPEGEDAGTITWESSDPTVATVHGNGEVYARAAGSTVITATNANGLSVMCDVTVQHNLISNGDFEFTTNEDLLYKHWTTNVLSNSAANIVADPDDDGNQVLSITTTDSVLRYSNAAVKRGKTYLLTGKYKGAATVRVHVGHGNGVVAHKVSGKEGTSSGWYDISGTAASDGWKTFELQFTTAAEGVEIAKGWNNNYIVPAFSNNQTETLYLDDIVLTEVDDAYKDSYTLTVGEMADGSVTLVANGSTISSGAVLTPGTYIDVTVAPNSGYQLTHGSLAYSYALPTVNGYREIERRVLNKNSSTFGADTNNTFRFVMPAEDVTLNALFEPTAAATDSIVATLGTSVYVKDDAVSGVRFLNRLYYTELNADTGKLYVTYNGKKLAVTQFGSLLKRATNDGELTLEAYDEHKNDGSATRIWKSQAMNNGNLYLVDYTNGYVDFTITMTSSVANRYAFLDRGYTVCGYVVLEDGTTIYTEAFTDTVLDALTRSL